MKEKCDRNMNFAECELAILRMQVDQAQEKNAKRAVNTPEIKKMINIVEKFIKEKKLVCYGGISINALLPDKDKIYNEEIDLPDYDFFSANALNDAKELAELYLKEGYTEVESKSAQHHGTYKVYVNFLGVADITSLPKELFNTIKKSAVNVKGILYTDANFLRMGMYLELSRPSGDTDRWEKVLKRLVLINKYYPLRADKCKTIEFQQQMENPKNEYKIYETVKNALINQDIIFFGGYAMAQYSQYMPKKLRKKIANIPDFDVLARDPKKTADIVKNKLESVGIDDVKIIKHNPIGEVIPEHYEIRVLNDTIAFIYKPIACHSYNVINLHGKKVRIATIDTMLSFYLAFLYANRGYYNKDRILCMAKFLFDVQEQNRLEQKGLLKRFSILCYGHQESREELRALKSDKFKELKNKNNTEYEEWFLNYKPKGIKIESASEESSTNKTTTKTNTIKKNKTNKTTKNKKNKTNKTTKNKKNKTNKRN